MTVTSTPPPIIGASAPPAIPRPHTVIENEKGKRFTLTPPSYASDQAINLTPNSVKVLEKRYLRRDLDGKLLETPAGMFYRVAYHLAQVEKEHNGDVETATRTFYDLMTERRFYPNSPTFTGAGTPLGQLAACFVLPIEDDMGKTSDGIFSTLRVAALIQQTGGGNGFSFNRLRPKGDVVHTSSGRATGPVGFLRVYDQAFGEIAQGGHRRGANMGVLRVDQSAFGVSNRAVVPLFHLRAVVIVAKSGGAIGDLGINMPGGARYVAYLDRRVGDAIYLDESRRRAGLWRMAEAIADVAELRLEYEASPTVAASKEN